MRGNAVSARDRGAVDTENPVRQRYVELLQRHQELVEQYRMVTQGARARQSLADWHLHGSAEAVGLLEGRRVLAGNRGFHELSGELRPWECRGQDAPRARGALMELLTDAAARSRPGSPVALRVASTGP